MGLNLSDYLGPPKLLNRDDKLALDLIRVNEADPHLRIEDQAICLQCKEKPCTVTCPVDNYRVEADGRTTIYWDSCIECGTCRIICPYQNVSWKYPAGGFGVSYRYG
jgi:ferredoxin like protein